ncbi:MAG: VWA domain-containing protein [Acidobacteriota bacterium]|nr:MAG: VWA domain-containing protein [Acidobacteriota bacterium]
MRNRSISAFLVFAIVAAAVGLILTLVRSDPAQKNDAAVSGRTEVSVLVTLKPHNDRTRAIADRLQASDFAIAENKQPQQIVSAVELKDRPVTLAVLIQDDLVSRVNNELESIRELIERLPKGSRVMTAYLTGGTIQVTQEFTSDKAEAARSLRILRSSSAGSPYNPYSEVIEAAEMFDDEQSGRRMILLVSDGLDISRGFRSASPSMSLDLDRAIEKAQQRSIAVYTFYAPSVGLTSFSRMAVNFGQGSLNRIADETGGEAFFSGTDFVTFDPYIREFEDTLDRQWLVTYVSDSRDKGFRRIEVTTDFDLHLHYQAGYWSR